MAPSTRDLLAAVLGERPLAAPVATPAPPTAARLTLGHVLTPPKTEAPGPWRVTASITGGLVQISNHHESRVIRKAQVEAYLRKGKPW